MLTVHGCTEDPRLLKKCQNGVSPPSRTPLVMSVSLYGVDERQVDGKT